MLIVGLGNPGDRYRNSRHNFGFLVVDQLAVRANITLDRKDFDARWGKGRIGPMSVLLAQPQTFMNLSGVAVRNLAGFFRLETSEMLVVHDDLDLPFATIRFKAGGGHGGHRGLMSLDEHLGSSAYRRLRMGIGRPGDLMSPESYVLQSFSPEEEKALPGILGNASEAIEVLIAEGMQTAMNRYHCRNRGEMPPDR